MNISSLPLNRNKYYEDENLNKLVDLALNNQNNDIFENILSFFFKEQYENMDKIISFIKSHNNKYDNSVYDVIKLIFDKIYSSNDVDNIRGTFLELLIYKFLDKKYISFSNDYLIEKDCHVCIDNYKSKRTVDVFALCFQKGFVCECKLNSRNLEDYNLITLNKIYSCSNELLKPYIITLSYEDELNKKLYEITLNDESNVWVNHDKIIKVCRNNLKYFLSFKS